MPVSKMAASVGYAFQNPDHQIFSYTVYEEVAFGPRNLMSLLVALNRQGTTVILITHDLELATEYCRWVYRLTQELGWEEPALSVDTFVEAVSGPASEAVCP